MWVLLWRPGNSKLIKSLEIKEVRLVYAPAAQSANLAAISITGFGPVTRAISPSTGPYVSPDAQVA